MNITRLSKYCIHLNDYELAELLEFITANFKANDPFLKDLHTKLKDAIGLSQLMYINGHDMGLNDEDR